MKIKIERIGVEQAPVVQKIYEASPEYFRRVDHSEVEPHFAEKDINDHVPVERRAAGYEKLYCLITCEDEPVGIVDLHSNHPRPGVVYIGLFLLKEMNQGRGLGRKCYEAVEVFIKSKLQAKSISLAVSEDNDVEIFWKKMGFERNGKTYVWQGAHHKNNVFEMDKSL